MSTRPPRILSVVGTRPEAIKMGPVIEALKARGGSKHRLALTGQHTELVDEVLARFEIESDYDLDLMKPGQDLFDIGIGCLEGLSEVTGEFRPDVTIVQGDTATVFFAGVSAFFQRGRIAHVEAGLRSHRKWSPFPEEMLRRMTDTISDYCFAPTRRAAENLLREGVEASRIFITGNTIVDSVQRARASSLTPDDPAVARLLAESRRLVLLTAHRRESFGAPLEGVFRAVAELSKRFPEVDVLYPVHPNPKVREPARRILGGGRTRIHLTAPLSHNDLLAVLDRASLVLTDSGGIQEEAPAFDVHTLVLREVTERPEALEAGAATLVGTDPERLLREATKQLADRVPTRITNPYGDGRAGERIADIILSSLTGSARETEDWLQIPATPLEPGRTSLEPANRDAPVAEGR